MSLLFDHPLADNSRPKLRQPRRAFLDPIAHPDPLIVEEGWACRWRTTLRSRTQIVSLILPGELILPRHADDKQDTQIECLTAVTASAVVPTFRMTGKFNDLIANERRWSENQILRLGRMDARERISHLFLELQFRHGLNSGQTFDQFPFPLSQNYLADLLGLTSVHINRTLQAMRSDRQIAIRERKLTILDDNALRRAALASI